MLRWALYEAARCAARPAAPDHSCYQGRRTAGLATLSVARKLARRCYHTLRELGEEAQQPGVRVGPDRRTGKLLYGTREET